MADTYTSNLNLVKFDAGSRENTWGTAFGTEVLDELDKAFGGKQSFSTTGGNRTLSVTDTSGVGMVVSGTLASNATLTMPLGRARKLVVQNNCTLGAFTLSVLTAGGSSTVVPAGTNLVWWDGTTGAPIVSTFVDDYEGNPNLVLKNSSSISAAAADVASAATTDISAPGSHIVRITGTTTITALGTADSGTIRFVRFAGSLTLTHNATTLILPGSANISTAANDTGIFISLGSGNWLCWDYKKADGTALVTSSSGSNVTASSTFSNDNRIIRSDGGSRGVQASAITVDDSGNMSGVGTISAGAISPSSVSASGSISGAAISGTTGTFSGDLSCDDISGGASGTLTSADASSAAGPSFTLYRNSGSPADADVGGDIYFQGRSSAAALRNYGRIYSQFTSVTNNSEVGQVHIGVMAAGAQTIAATFMGAGTAGATGIGVGVADAIDPTSGTSAGVYINRTGQIINRTNGTVPMYVCRVDDGNLIGLVGQTTVEGTISVSGTTITYGTFAGAHLTRLPSEEPPDILQGTIMQTAGGLVKWMVGEYIDENGETVIHGEVPKHITAPGQTYETQISVEVDVTTEYEVDETYKDRLGRNRKRKAKKVKVGTARQNVTVLCTAREKQGDLLPFSEPAEEWSDHPYGVFQSVDHQDDDYNDFNVVSLGAYKVRMQPDTIGLVEVGDLIRTGLNGCGVPISEKDKLSALALAKVHVATITSTEVLDLYEDGSYTLPATIHAG